MFIPPGSLQSHEGFCPKCTIVNIKSLTAFRLCNVSNIYAYYLFSHGEPFYI